MEKKAKVLWVDCQKPVSIHQIAWGKEGGWGFTLAGISFLHNTLINQNQTSPLLYPYSQQLEYPHSIQSAILCLWGLEFAVPGLLSVGCKMYCSRMCKAQLYCELSSYNRSIMASAEWLTLELLGSIYFTLHPQNNENQSSIAWCYLPPSSMLVKLDLIWKHNVIFYLQNISLIQLLYEMKIQQLS